MKIICSITVLLISAMYFTQNGKVENKGQETLEQTTPFTVQLDVLKCYIGAYVLHTDTMELVVEVILKEDRLLYIEKRGDRTFETELHPLSSNKFFFKENDAIIHFGTTVNCESPSFDITINGATYKCMRKV